MMTTRIEVHKTEALVQGKHGLKNLKITGWKYNNTSTNRMAVTPGRWGSIWAILP